MKDGTVVDVCCTAFMHIHMISEKRLRVALDKQSMTGTVVPDQKGRHVPGVKVSQFKRNLVKEHNETCYSL